MADFTPDTLFERKLAMGVLYKHAELLQTPEGEATFNQNFNTKTNSF